MREKELRSWPPEKRLVFVNDMTDTFGEFYSFEQIEEWHQHFERHAEREFQLLPYRP
jgi:protein gp37